MTTRQNFRRLARQARLTVVMLCLAITSMFVIASPAHAGEIGSTGWQWPLGSSPTVASGGEFLGNGCGPNGTTSRGGYGYYANNLFHLGIDMSATANTNVAAIGSGVVKNSDGNFGNDGGVVLIEHTAADGSKFVAVYGHLKNYITNGTVQAGDLVGKVNTDHAHLGIHPGLYSSFPSNGWGTLSCSSYWTSGNSPTSTNGFVDPVPYLNSHAAVVASTPTSQTTERVVARVGNLLYTTTSSNSAWQQVSNTATAGGWKSAGDRIAVLDSYGLWVRDGNSNFSQWGANDIQEFQVSEQRVVARVGSNLYTTTAGNIAWQLISNTATAGNWKLSGDRIGLLDSSGLWVRDGNNSFTQWGGSDVQEFQVSEQRVVARVGSNLYTTTASNISWQLASNTAASGSWKLSGNRIGLLDSSGLWVRDGNNSFTQWGGSDVQEFQVSEQRVVARVGSNLYTTTAGNIAWQLISNTATAGSWKLSLGRIALLDDNGLLVNKDAAGWVVWGASDVQEFQL